MSEETDVGFGAETAAAQGLACCHVCLKLTEESGHFCSLCGGSLHFRIPNSLQRTVALTITAIVLYIPANLFPIMTTDQLGYRYDSTIIGGVILLWQDGSYPVAAVIFVASVLVPIGKVLSLSWLCWSISGRHGFAHRHRTFLYRVTELIGKWSMTDVFVVSVLVALIHLGGLLTITPGPAAVAFGAMVVFTMLAARSFDPRLIWDQEERGHG
jgi:paraquat-inducible protein A